MTPTSRYLVVGVALVAAVSGGASALRYRSDQDAKPPGTGALAQVIPDAGNETPGTFHMPSSADKVSMTVSMSSANGTNDNWTMAITLHIAKGWHVNTNPASLPFLIPTTVQAKVAGKAVPVIVQYPSGRDSDIRLGGKPIMVYDDNTTFVARFRAGESQILQSTRNVTILVTVQSCSDQGICLPPSTLSEAVHLKT